MSDKTFGTPMMRKLCAESRELGIEMDFYRDSSGKYHVWHENRDDEIIPGKAITACHYMMGVIAGAERATGIIEEVNPFSEEIREMMNEANRTGQAAIMVLVEGLHSNARIVSAAMKQLWELKKQLPKPIERADTVMFRKCYDWVANGRILSGKFRTWAVSAICQRYLENLAVSIIKRDSGRLFNVEMGK